MTREDIIRHLLQAADDTKTLVTNEPNWPLLMRFAALVAAHEREQCARVVENCCSYCAERIRERDGKPREPVQCNISIEDVTKAALKILDTELTKQGLQP